MAVPLGPGDEPHRENSVLEGSSFLLILLGFVLVVAGFIGAILLIGMI